MPKNFPTTRELVAFISSTYLDLKLFREKVEDALSRVEAGFRTMRYFGSKDGDPLDQCLSKLSQSNYYIGIIGYRYGSIHSSSQKSLTELEYEEAKRLGMSRRIYLAASSVQVQPDHVESDEKRRMLESFKQKLKKENSIVEFSSPDDLASKVLADLLLGLPQKDEIALSARTKYLPAIRTSCASISFLGLDIRSMKRHKDVKLEKVFVKSEFKVIATSSEVSVEQALVWKKRAYDMRAGAKWGTVRLGTLLTLNHNVVILGAPGSGKTTLAKYLVVAQVDRLPEMNPFAADAIPIRIPLRAYAEYRQRAGGIGRSILDFLHDFVRSEFQLNSLPEGFFEYFLESGKAILIFDGLDEVFDSHLREQVRNDIQAFALTSFPGNRVLVTSRKVGYEEAGFPEPTFQHFEIVPFDQARIGEYVRKWYAMEEADSRKRREEIAAFHRASQNLPHELLSNPLLLSLIVILFRAGCTLPESKLEIYRSCVGTLTEKWDAAGKKLELPPHYNLVRDKKGALARIAYWMYKEATLEPSRLAKLKYPQILQELTVYLQDREFKGREAEAHQAAECFLDYAAKRSIFVEDRFTHKTFHEYFAALYLFRNFCLGRTPEELYAELKLYLGRDNWAVALELLLLMLDENAGTLVDKIFELAAADSVSLNPDLLLVPLRTLSELQNVAASSVGSVIASGVEVCAKARDMNPWDDSRFSERPHQRVFAALEDLPAQFRPMVVDSLRTRANATSDLQELLAIAAFVHECRPRTGFPEASGLVPGWETTRAGLVKHHLGLFYHVYADAPISEQVRLFATLFGVDRFAIDFPLLFKSNSYYISLVEHVLQVIRIPKDVASFDLALEDILSSEFLDNVLAGLVERDPSNRWPILRVGVPVNHILADWEDGRKYLIDWLVLGMSVDHWDEVVARERKSAIKKLRGAISKGKKVQSFYASLLLGQPPPESSANELGISSRVFAGIRRVMQPKPPSRISRVKGRTS